MLGLASEFRLRLVPCDRAGPDACFLVMADSRERMLVVRSDRVALEVTGSCWEVARILEPHVNRVVVVSPDDTGITSARARPTGWMPARWRVFCGGASSRRCGCPMSATARPGQSLKAQFHAVDDSTISLPLLASYSSQALVRARRRTRVLRIIAAILQKGAPPLVHPWGASAGFPQAKGADS
jgi:hypothetical protein